MSDRDGAVGGVDTGDRDATDPSAVDRLGRAVGRVDERVAAVRADPARRRTLLAAGVVGGLALAWVHWVGLVLGGAAVGVSRRSLPRAVLAGLGVGALSLVLTVLLPGTVGVGAVSALAPVSYVGIALGLVLPAWGALVRGVV